MAISGAQGTPGVTGIGKMFSVKDGFLPWSPRSGVVISTAPVMGPYSIPTPLGIRRGHCSDRGENSYMMRIGEAHLLTFHENAGIRNRKLLDLGPRLGVLDSVHAHALWWIMGLTSRGKGGLRANRVIECRVSVAEHY